MQCTVETGIYLELLLMRCGLLRLRFYSLLQVIEAGSNHRNEANTGLLDGATLGA